MCHAWEPTRQWVVTTAIFLRPPACAPAAIDPPSARPAPAHPRNSRLVSTAQSPRVSIPGSRQLADPDLLELHGRALRLQAEVSRARLAVRAAGDFLAV